MGGVCAWLAAGKLQSDTKTYARFSLFYFAQRISIHLVLFAGKVGRSDLSLPKNMSSCQKSAKHSAAEKKVAETWLVQ